MVATRSIKRENSDIGLQTPTKKRRVTDTSISPDPVTPTHDRVSKKLFRDEISKQQNQQLATPPATPQTPLSLAKSIFQRSSANQVIGRDKERKALDKVFQQRNGSLYISGLPGTGKSALVTELYNTTKKKKVFINCMVSSSQDIFGHIYSGLTGGKKSSTSASSSLAAQNKLEKLIYSSKHDLIVILDELDHILTKDQQVLFKLFQWAASPKSSLLLIGIANALDLTDRFFPRLKANNITPQQLAFTPYTAAQITEIIQRRLQCFGEDSPMHPAAIQLCARKTAANTGDIRKAFDICRRALELVEFQHQQKQQQESPTTESVKPPKVMVMHVSKICSMAFGGSTVSRIKTLNLHQKAVLCVLVGRPEVETVTDLFETFNRVSSRDNLLGTLQFGELLQMVSALESSGVVTLSGGKAMNNGQRRVSTSVQKVDLMTGISDVDLLKKFVTL